MRFLSVSAACAARCTQGDGRISGAERPLSRHALHKLALRSFSCAAGYFGFREQALNAVDPLPPRPSCDRGTGAHHQAPLECVELHIAYLRAGTRAQRRSSRPPSRRVQEVKPWARVLSPVEESHDPTVRLLLDRASQYNLPGERRAPARGPCGGRPRPSPRARHRRPCCTRCSWRWRCRWQLATGTGWFGDK